MIFFCFFFSLIFSRDLPNSPKNVRPWHRAPVVVTGSSTFCSCYPPRPSKARWNRHLLCSFVLSQTSGCKTFYSTIDQKFNCQFEWWEIHHCKFEFTTAHLRWYSSAANKQNQILFPNFDIYLTSLPQWNTTLTLRLTFAWNCCLPKNIQRFTSTCLWS